jgi:hypothetical protein
LFLSINMLTHFHSMYTIIPNKHTPNPQHQLT